MPTESICAESVRFLTEDLANGQSSSGPSCDRWGTLAADVIEAILKKLPQSAVREIRLVNRHWSVAGRALIRSLAVDMKAYTNHSQMGSYLSRLVDGTYCNLKHLRLRSQFREGYSNLTLLTSVMSLDISGCSADTHQLSGIKSLTQLSALSMGFTQLTDEGAAFLSDLENLTSLNLEWCHITEDALKQFGKLTKLSRLTISGMGWISTECLRPLQQHLELTALDLSSIDLSDECLAPISNLIKLTQLNLAMNPLTCAAMDAVSVLTQLRTLNLKKTTVGNEGIRCLSSLVRLRRLNLSGTVVDDHGMLFLTQLGLLSSLDLSDNFMVGWNNLEHLMPFTSLGFLHKLYLQKTQATPVTVRALADSFRPRKLWIEF